MTPRRPGLSVRWKLTLSYAGFLLVTGAVLLVAGYFSLSRGDHPGVLFMVRSHDDLLRSFAPMAVSVMTFLLVVGLGGGWVLAGRMLAPLARITDATRLAATGSLSHRIALDGPSDELRELADAFDAMLGRLAAHVAEQERFAANASHELRTPLAITQTLLEVARNDPSPDVGALVERLLVVNGRAIDLTEALLALSRAGAEGLAREPVDLSLLAEEAAETLLPLAERRHVSLSVEGGPLAALAIGSRALLLQLTTNLVHNAIVHNLDRCGSVWVRTSVEEHGRRSVLVVENTGAELDLDRTTTLVEPFLRAADRARRSDHAGTGLGLAIVRRIADAHGATLSLSPRAGGGLCVRIELPAG